MGGSHSLPKESGVFFTPSFIEDIIEESKNEKEGICNIETYRHDDGEEYNLHSMTNSLSSVNTVTNGNENYYESIKEEIRREEELAQEGITKILSEFDRGNMSTRDNRCDDFKNEVIKCYKEKEDEKKSVTECFDEVLKYNMCAKSVTRVAES